MYYQGLTLCRLFQIRKQNAVEDAEDPEPEPKEKTVTVLKLTEGLELIEAGVKVFEDVGCKKRRAS